MNYAWEAVLQAERHGREREGLRFVEASDPSPYIEVSVMDLNLESPEEDTVEINQLYRFGDVFGRLFDRNIEGMEQTRQVFFDVCMHYIVQLDLRQGLSGEDFFCSLLRRDIREGRYGEGACRRFRLFDRMEQKGILRAGLHLLKTGNHMEEFRRALLGVYPGAFLYENNETAHELLVYLGVAESERERERTSFLRDMFLPAQATVHWFYGHHFGIIGVDETMVVDDVVVF